MAGRLWCAFSPVALLVASIGAAGPTTSANAREQPTVTAVGASPPAAMAYDPEALATVLVRPGAIVSKMDVLSWDGVRWRQVTTAQMPRRSGASMVYDTIHRAFVLVGGIDLDDGAVGAERTPAAPFTVTGSGASWHLHTSAPDLRTGQAMAFDPIHGQAVLFGGALIADGDPTSTWLWDGDRWSEVRSTHRPPPRSAASMAFDLVSRTVLLFGGVDIAGGSSGDRLGDTWSWNGTDWTEVALQTAPSARLSAGMALDRSSGHIVLFGGDAGASTSSTTTPLDDTWEWTGAAWMLLTPTTRPEARFGALTSSSPDALLMVGGTDAHGNQLQDTWRWSGGTWTRDPVAIVTNAVPRRVLDSRPGEGQIGYTWGKPAAGDTIVLDLTRPPADEGAIILNLTGTEPRAPGWIAARPCLVGSRTTSSLNLDADETAANLIIVDVSKSRNVCFDMQSGVHLVADEIGYLPADSAYVPVGPARLYDSRIEGVRVRPPLPAGSVRGFSVSPSVPDDATAVVLNITATNVSSAGFVTVWPCGQVQPLASTLNVDVGQTRANLVISAIGDHRMICLYTKGSAELIADVSGYFSAGSSYRPLLPTRMLDTRIQTALGGVRPGARDVVSVVLHDPTTGNAMPEGSVAVLNVTGVEPAAPGFITVWACSAIGAGVRPLSSNLNLAAGDVRPNAVITRVGPGGLVCLYTHTSADLVIDLNGWFPG